MQATIVSVIIVNYNTKEMTQQCINSIVENTYDIGYEIILVDNASIDGSKEFFRTDSRILLIESDINLGFGKANNLGYKYAKGEYIFLLNSDTILLNNAIKLFHEEHSVMPSDIACVGTLLKAKDGITINSSYDVYPSIVSTLKQIKNIYTEFLFSNKSDKTLTTKLYPATPFNVEYIIGADLFIRDSVIKQHGLFDPDFFMYFEESEMQYRYSLAGLRSVIIDTPQIIHLEGASTLRGKKYNYRERLMFFRSMFIFMRKRYSKLQYLSFRILSLLFIPIVIKSHNTLKQNTEILKLFFGGK